MDAARFRSLFVDESREHLAAAQTILRGFDAGIVESDATRELLRHAHSLKGMAATMGFITMAELAHAIEDRFAALSPSSSPAGPKGLELVRVAIDSLSRMLDRIEAGASPEDPASGVLAGSLRAHRTMASWQLDLELTQLAASAQVRVVHELVLRLASLGRVIHASARATSSGAGRKASVRLLLASPVEAERIDALLAEQAGLASWRRQPESPRTSPPAHRTRAAGWVRVRAEQLDHLQDRVRVLVAECARLRVADSSVHGLARVVAEVRHGVRDLDLLPFDHVRFRLERGVAELSRRLERPARLEIENPETVLEREILDAITEPLLHAVRNAVDHGIEPATERAARGKPPEGRIRVRVCRNSRQLTIEIADDGRGLDPVQLRRVAVERGWLTSAEAMRLGDCETLQLVTRPGFSTADRLSLSSGRGMGLDIVVESLAKLGGTVRIESLPGEGATVLLEVPASRLRVPALRVRDAGECYLLPLAAILRVEGPIVDDSEESAWRCVSLSKTEIHSNEANVRRPRVLARGADGPIAISVDEIVGVIDPVIDPLAPPLSRVAPFSGASLLEDGTIALVVEPAQL